MQSQSQSYKDSEMWYFCEDCDHGHSPIAILIKKTMIMVKVL